jgi:hypothetical protein
MASGLSSALPVAAVLNAMNWRLFILNFFLFRYSLKFHRSTHKQSICDVLRLKTQYIAMSSAGIAIKRLPMGLRAQDGALAAS